MVLETQYRTKSISTIAQLEALPSSPAFHLVVLCHSLSASDCNRAVVASRTLWPAAKILAISSGRDSCATLEPDEVVSGLQGPAALFVTIASLLSQLPQAAGVPQAAPFTS